MPADKQLLELDSRRRIYDHLRRVPGLHLRQIQRDLAMPMGTLEYHLYQMEKGGLLVTREDGRFKAFYPKESLDRRDRDFLYYLRQDMPRHIALEIVGRPGITFQELAARLPIGASTLSFHLKKLRAGVLIEERRRGQKKCYVATDPDRIRRIILRYRRTFVDAIVDRFAQEWLEVGPVPTRPTPPTPPMGL